MSDRTPAALVHGPRQAIDRHDLPRPDLPEDTGQLRTAHLAASGTSVITADPWMTA